MSLPQDDALQLKAALSRIYRQLRQTKDTGTLTLPESSALTSLERHGPTTAAALAKLERITPQSMGTSLTSLERRGLVQRAQDPQDGRRVILSLTEAGRDLVAQRRSARTEQLARALSEGFTAEERAQIAASLPLLERLAELIR